MIHYLYLSDDFELLFLIIFLAIDEIFVDGAFAGFFWAAFGWVWGPYREICGVFEGKNRTRSVFKRYKHYGLFNINKNMINIYPGTKALVSD